LSFKTFVAFAFGKLHSSPSSTRVIFVATHVLNDKFCQKKLDHLLYYCIIYDKIVGMVLENYKQNTTNPYEHYIKFQSVSYSGSYVPHGGTVDVNKNQQNKYTLIET
jgi:hypothetical protein